MATINESIAKEYSLGQFQEIGYWVLPGTLQSIGEPAAERETLTNLVLVSRLRLTIGGLTQPIARLRKQLLHNLQQFNPVAA
jgi:type I restriction enzyme R subunit